MVAPVPVPAMADGSLLDRCVDFCGRAFYFFSFLPVTTLYKLGVMVYGKAQEDQQLLSPLLFFFERASQGMARDGPGVAFGVRLLLENDGAFRQSSADIHRRLLCLCSPALPYSDIVTSSRSQGVTSGKLPSSSTEVLSCTLTDRSSLAALKGWPI